MSAAQLGTMGFGPVLVLRDDWAEADSGGGPA